MTERRGGKARGGRGRGPAGQGKPGGKAGRTADSRLYQPVRTAKKRTASSTRWLERQLNDPLVAEAKRLGYRSRAAFKLLQLDERFGLLKPGMRVVDLGAAPGAWTQIAVTRSGADGGKGVVIGLDKLAMDPIPGATLITMDFLSPEAPEALTAALGGPADLVLSDMAAETTGHRATDHLRIVALAEAALAFAADVLRPGGTFVCKLFQGGAQGPLRDRLHAAFATVRNVKPAASRAESAEHYILATGFRGAKTEAAPDT